jgi:hypothetical protein
MCVESTLSIERKLLLYKAQLIPSVIPLSEGTAPNSISENTQCFQFQTLSAAWYRYSLEVHEDGAQ